MWSTPVDLYCERVDPSFWAEPINAITNLAFIIAAIIAWLCWRARGGGDLPSLALITVTFIVGAGSFAFHTLATRGAVLLDVIPIAVFIYGYFLLALRRYLKLSLLVSIVILALFIGGSQYLEGLLPRGFLNGSGGYLPALAAMLVIGGLTCRQRAGRLILTAAGLFTVSLFFRAIDQSVCAAFPLGTHFLWHMLNATVLYVLLHAAIETSPRALTTAS